MAMHTSRVQAGLGFVAVLMLSAPFSVGVRAQQTPPTKTPQVEAPTVSAQAQPAPAAASAGFTYDPQGRRDPFVSLLTRGTDPKSMINRPPGLPGVLIGEITVKGIVRDRSGFIAMVQAPDNKTYIVRPGEKLMDGSVKSITPDTVVFSQDVNDPLSPVKQREIRKSVRMADQPRG